MKLSYNKKTGDFIVSELGRIVDSDSDLDALAVRYGFVAESADDEMTDQCRLKIIDEDVSKEKKWQTMLDLTISTYASMN